MITRNVLGKIEPRIGKYFVQKNAQGKYEIMKDEPWYITKAVLYDAVLMWQIIEPFDSLFKAYAWLKENIDNLL